MAKNDEMMLGKVRNGAKIFLCTVEIALCIAIICVVYWELTAYWYSYDGTTVYYACLLGDNSEGNNMCTYTYTLAGVSMATAFLFVCSACIPCECWKYMTLVYDGVLVIFHLLWWLAGGIVLGEYNANASDQQKSIQSSSRDAVTGMCWTMFALVVLDYGVWMFIVFYNICGYFGGRKAKEQREAEKAQDHQDEMMANGTLNPVTAHKVELDHPTKP